MTDDYQKFNYEILMDAIGKADLTANEIKTLEWLSGWEESTARTVAAIIKKARTAEPIKKTTEKRKVYPVTVFFTEESGLPVSETYYAESYSDIERVKKEIREDYAPEDIESIIADDEPTIEEFYI